MIGLKLNDTSPKIPLGTLLDFTDWDSGGKNVPFSSWQFEIVFRRRKWKSGNENGKLKTAIDTVESEQLVRGARAEVRVECPIKSTSGSCNN